MTLTELKYIIAVARERHFGRAAEACFVSQPTLSVAIRKLEDELGVILFERGGSEIGVTPIGQRIVSQAQKVLEESGYLKEIARQGHDPLAGALKLGVIYTVGPYLLPNLMPAQISRTPQMPLILQESYTARLIELLRQGEIDCAIMALPIPENGFEYCALYEEDFVVAVPANHPLAQQSEIDASLLKNENMLLLGSEHCFRDQVLEVCPEMSRFSPNSDGIQRSFEGSSLETIRHMVAAGLGITLLPSSSLHYMNAKNDLVKYVPLKTPVPNRCVVLAWRRSFTRVPAIQALIETIRHSGIEGVRMLSGAIKIS